MVRNRIGEGANSESCPRAAGQDRYIRNARFPATPPAPINPYLLSTGREVDKLRVRSRNAQWVAQNLHHARLILHLLRRLIPRHPAKTLRTHPCAQDPFVSQQPTVVRALKKDARTP
jgi:hypothetical protein